MVSNEGSGKPTTRRYSPEEKAAAVRMVRTLRAELGTEHGTVQRVATQLGYGIESVRTWVKQADIDDGNVAGVTTAESRKLRELEQEVRELRRANEILKRAALDSNRQRNTKQFMVEVDDGQDRPTRTASGGTAAGLGYVEIGIVDQ